MITIKRTITADDVEFIEATETALLIMRDGRNAAMKKALASESKADFDEVVRIEKCIKRIDRSFYDFCKDIEGAEKIYNEIYRKTSIHITRGLV